MFVDAGFPYPATMGSARLVLSLSWMVAGCGGAIAPESATPDAAGVPDAGLAEVDASSGPAVFEAGFDVATTTDSAPGPTTADVTVDAHAADAAPAEASVRGGPDACIPATCASLGYDCGRSGDGCGGVLVCDTSSACPAGTFCGGGGFNKCGASSACTPAGPIETPLTCEQGVVDCGLSGDGFGGLLDCGSCPPSYVCSASKCVPKVDAGPCVPATCADYGATCGKVGDGCGGTLDCGRCGPSQYCGGAGVHRCGGTCSVQPISMQADCGVETVCMPDTNDADSAVGLEAGTMDAADACATCGAGQVCVASQIVSGGDTVSTDDAGQCPTGFVVVPEAPHTCSRPTSYACASPPAACAPPDGSPPLDACSCAPSICPPMSTCTNPTPTHVRCLVVAPVGP